MLFMACMTMIPSRSTKGGSLFFTVWILFWTFTTAAFGSVPGSKMTVIVASPALVASEVMYRMFGTPLIDCSRITRTESTRTLALAPGKETVTTTLGGATEGNCEIASLWIDNTPRNKMMIEMTIANVGRWRNCENMAIPRGISG